MASSHENIDFSLAEVGPLFDSSIIQGTVTSIDTVNNTANVTTSQYGALTDVPIHFHCYGESTIDNGNAAFMTGDSVKILREPFAKGSTNADYYIIGLWDGSKRHCDLTVYLRVTIDSYPLKFGGQKFRIRYTDSDSVEQVTDWAMVKGNVTDTTPDTKMYQYAGPFTLYKPDRDENVTIEVSRQRDTSWCDTTDYYDYMSPGEYTGGSYTPIYFNYGTFFEYFVTDVSGSYRSLIETYGFHNVDLYNNFYPGSTGCGSGASHSGNDYMERRLTYRATYGGPSLDTGGDFDETEPYSDIFKRVKAHTTKYNRVEYLAKTYTFAQFQAKIGTESQIYHWQTPTAGYWEYDQNVFEDNFAWNMKVWKYTAPPVFGYYCPLNEGGWMYYFSTPGDMNIDEGATATIFPGIGPTQFIPPDFYSGGFTWIPANSRYELRYTGGGGSEYDGWYKYTVDDGDLLGFEITAGGSFSHLEAPSSNHNTFISFGAIRCVVTFDLAIVVAPDDDLFLRLNTPYGFEIPIHSTSSGSKQYEILLANDGEWDLSVAWGTSITQGEFTITGLTVRPVDETELYTPEGDYKMLPFVEWINQGDYIYDMDYLLTGDHTTGWVWTDPDTYTGNGFEDLMIPLFRPEFFSDSNPGPWDNVRAPIEVSFWREYDGNHYQMSTPSPPTSPPWPHFNCDGDVYNTAKEMPYMALGAMTIDSTSAKNFEATLTDGHGMHQIVSAENPTVSTQTYSHSMSVAGASCCQWTWTWDDSAPNYGWWPASGCTSYSYDTPDYDITTGYSISPSYTRTFTQQSVAMPELFY